jgi:hypothetical protein
MPAPPITKPLVSIVAVAPLVPVIVNSDHS